jgi:tRNA (mo5U34)-methyltransferase
MPMLDRGSDLQKPLLDQIQSGTMSYTYKGIPCLKSPFDLALYQLLVGEAMPRTILEIGSHLGGSALWFADLMRTNSLPPNVHSVDIKAVDAVLDGVTFYLGDANRLQDTLDPALLATLPHPWLVIEDAGHQAESTYAVLEFFSRWLQVGEYIVVEDGIVQQLGIAAEYNGGPVAGAANFLEAHPGQFEIDRRFCDWYGRNVTYNVSGFLRKLSEAPRECRSAKPEQEARRSLNIAKAKQKSWFYEFELPDGSKTQSWLPDDVAAIHPCRLEKLRQIISTYVNDASSLTAVDFAAHEGFYTVELARHFCRVEAYEVRKEHVDAARLILDILDVPNVSLTQIDLGNLAFNPSLQADFVLLYGLLYHLENPIRLLRLASQMTRKHILIETQVFPYDLMGRIEDGFFEHQRDVNGVLSLSPDYPDQGVGGSTSLALVPSVNALTSILWTLGFEKIEFLEFQKGDYEQFRRGARVIVYGQKSNSSA